MTLRRRSTNSQAPRPPLKDSVIEEYAPTVIPTMGSVYVHDDLNEMLATRRDYGAINGHHHVRDINILATCSTDFLDVILEQLRDAAVATLFSLPLSTEASEWFERQLVTPSRQSVKAISHLRDLMKVSYDKSNDAHEDALEEIWNLLTNGAPREDRFTKEWGRLGFQGKDPGTDFRGCGFLGLTVFRHFARTHTETCKAFIDEHSKSFPLALAVISVTEALVRLLEAHPYTANVILRSSHDPERSLDLFCELFAKVFTSFGRYHHNAIDTFIQGGGIPELARMQHGEIHKQFFGSLGSNARLAKEWREDGHCRNVSTHAQLGCGRRGIAAVC